MNNYILDGIDNNNNSGGGAQLGVNVDAIAEFKIQTNSYDPNSDHAKRRRAAALNVVIKSGTNEFHGSVFEFFQNGYLNGQNFFRNDEALFQVQSTRRHVWRSHPKEQAVLFRRLPVDRLSYPGGRSFFGSDPRLR